MIVNGGRSWEREGGGLGTGGVEFDGSQVVQKGTYGWVLIGREGECHNISGKVVSRTRDMDSYQTGLHGLMSLAGVGSPIGCWNPSMGGSAVTIIQNARGIRADGV
mmetsp:Transcript_896/g.1136  ORF Transcript_896/g.1136 Transcript_896/m.1136 type:complete len:106 (-) Transcript_896:532-849(-)